MIDKISKCLRPWCHKIIPLIYDNSLSYYEVLCKLTAKVNEIIELFNEEINPLDLEKIVDDIMEEWMDNGTIYSILAGKIPEQVTIRPEYIATYTLPHGAYNNTTTWECIQSICFIDASNGVGVRSANTGSGTNVAKAFKFNRNTGIQIGADVNVVAGHANDICCDGEYIYIAWCYDMNEDSSNKITVCDLNLNTIRTITLDVTRIYGMDYNKELKQFFVMTSNSQILVYDKTLTNVVSTISINVSYYKNYYSVASGRFTTQTLTCFPDGFLVGYSYPSIAIKFDMNGEITHIYNLAKFYDNGFNTFEYEKIAYNWSNGWCYITTYAVQGLADLSNNTYGRFNLNKGQVTDLIVVASTRPNYYNADGRLHVDNTVSNNAKMLGTGAYPFKYLQQAVDCAIQQDQDLMIVVHNVRTVSNLGTVAISKKSNLIITALLTDGTNDNFDNPNMFIPEMRVTDCSEICIFNVNIGNLSLLRTSGVQIAHTQVGTKADFNRAINTSLIANNKIELLDIASSSLIGRALTNNDITLGTHTLSYDVGTIIS